MSNLTMPQTAFVSLSSNLPSAAGRPDRTLDQCIELVAQKAELLALSRRYLTSPVGVKLPMPDFLNQVIKLNWQGTACELLEFLLKTEDGFGRKRSEDASLGPLARTLDLDLLLFGNETWALPELTVPHPRMFERAFVLVPLLDIWLESDVIPGQVDSRVYLRKCLSKLDCSVDSQYIKQNN